MLSSNTSATSDSATYVEDVFSTYLYTGTGATLSIVNNIDLATKGGMTWIKSRSNIRNHNLFDTNRGATKKLFSNLTNAQDTDATSLTSFNTDGFSLGTAADDNTSGWTYASWTFRKQPKFFDVVTYTGNGAANRDIAHSLGSVPGCMIIKRTDGVKDWIVYHRSLSTNQFMNLNSAGSVVTGTQRFPSAPTASVFTLGTDSDVNGNGFTYVAYLFAHDAGGFGLTGTDNVISCGSFTGAGSTTPVTVNLGFEPQWILAKQSSGTGGSWVLVDNMRGFTATTNGNVVLYPNSTSADDPGNYIPGQPTSTGLNGLWSSGETYIYIAIRRGPMKVPTDATKVFAPVTTSNDTSPVTTNFPVDLFIESARSSTSGKYFYDRLRGSGYQLTSTTTDAEVNASITGQFTSNTSVTPATLGAVSSIVWNFKRAPSFFDEVCYVATGSARTVSHNLGVAPELIITKSRTSANQWGVYHVGTGNTNGLYLSSNGVPITSAAFWNNTSPTSSVFTVGSSSATNSPASDNFVAYLFATCAGVSKVGSYTGNGTSQTINCGFTAGSRFILIKRTNLAEDWYVWDSARGIISGNDPSLRLNVTNAESTIYDSIDPDSSGFIVNQDAAENINVNGSTYIFLAIA